MNFFKTVFSDDPPLSGDSHEPEKPELASDLIQSFNSAWVLGGLIRTLASKSESVIENYRRDLEEFGSGLKKETAVIREAASRAVKGLPASLDVGASVAQESLESVGQAIDDIGSSVWKSTTQIISHGRSTLLAAGFDSDSSDNSNNSNNNIVGHQLNSSSHQESNLKRYSRFDALVHALLGDVNTYLEEPEDSESYREWKLEFELDKREEEIENLMKENILIEEIYSKVVPSRTDHETFWSRYFYKLNKLKQAEDARAMLVKRAIAADEEEDLSWDFDDEDDGYEPKGNSSGSTGSVGTKMKGFEINGRDKSEVKYDGNVASNTSRTVSDSGEKLDVKNDEKAASEGKTDHGESCKDSDVSVVSSQPSMAEEIDIGWDKFEDVGSNDENREDAIGITSRIDLRKRFNAADQEEDLSWDIEDDDEPLKL